MASVNLLVLVHGPAFEQGNHLAENRDRVVRRLAARARASAGAASTTRSR